MKNIIALTLLLIASPLIAQGKTVCKFADGSQVSADLVEIKNGIIRLKTSDGTKTVELSSIIGLEISSKQSFSKGTAVLDTIDGSSLAVYDLEMKGENLNFTHNSQKLAISISSVAAIWLPNAGQTKRDVVEQCNDNGFKSGIRDMIVMTKKSGGLLTPIGQLISFDNSAVSFKYKGKVRKIKLSRIKVIFPGQAAATAPQKNGTLNLVDGSIIRFDSISFSRSKFKITSGKLKLTYSGDIVAGIIFTADNITKLESIKPEKVEYSPVLGMSFPMVMNKSTLKRPLKLDGVYYETGIGVHSQSKLIYNLAGKYKLLSFKVGIDDNARPLGNATIIILADGKEIKRVDVSAASGAVGLNLKTEKVNKLEIIIDKGKDKRIVGDHVDIVEGRLVKA